MVFGSESKSWPMTKWLDVNRQQMSQIAPRSREYRLLGLRPSLLMQENS